MQPIAKNIGDVEKIELDDSMAISILSNSVDMGELDIAIAELDGIHSKRVNNRSIKLYNVIDGKVTFDCAGQKYTIFSGGVFILPPNVWCEMHGEKSKFSIICAPAFCPDDETIL